MMLRDYQARAVTAARGLLDAGKRTLIVAPTGSGKTVMGVAAIGGATDAIWICHRIELVDQARAKLPDSVTVETIQTLLARADGGRGKLVVLDECHHYAADAWGEAIASLHPRAVLGLTATPERPDGRGLAHLFDHLITAAQYSELIAAGHLVDCDLLRPSESLGSDLAQPAHSAWAEHAAGRRGFAFFRSVEECLAFCEVIPRARTISYRTGADERADTLAAFRAGDLDVLCSVYALTEGVDVPESAVCLLARGCAHASTYLQMVGRVLRPCAGKTRALLIDLPGVSHGHGAPTEDRVYSLQHGIKTAKLGALKMCPTCGATVEAAAQTCEVCGHEFGGGVGRPPPKIWDVELRKVFAGELTPVDAKRREWQRISGMCAERGFSLSWGVREYKKLFHAAPDVTADQERSIVDQLRQHAVDRGYKPGYALAIFKQEFGRWPRR